MRLNSSEEFVEGHHNIGRVSDSFREHFHGQPFTVPANADYVEHFIRRAMTDQEILAELKPEVCLLGDLFNLLHQPGQWPWSLCYIRDSSGNLRTVHFWRQDGEWSIDDSGSRTGTWNEVSRVYGPKPAPFWRRMLQRLGGP